MNDYEIEVTDKAIDKIFGIIESDDDYSAKTTLFRIHVTGKTATDYEYGIGLEFKKDEHIFYVHFDTENDIEFVQFTMSDEIRQISDVCSDSTAWEKNVPIHCRYERFEKSNLNKILIREIKKNIVE